MNIELSVIIVNYNGQRFLKDCLESLRQKLIGISSEIIVIDNNSQDESCTYIKENYPEIKLIESKINYGFGKGNNEAFKQSKGEYLLLINNDTIVLDSLKPVLEKLKSDKSIGAIGINMLNGNKNYLPVSGNFPNFINLFWMKKIQESNTEFKSGNFLKTCYEVDWLSGSFLMIPRRVYTEINGFDEDYFLYVEDVDLCKRISDKGYKRVFLSQYSYIHFVGFNKSKNPLLVKGYEIYISKHFKGVNKIIISTSLKINKFVKKLKSN
ncbi:glycosyltransferase family 2 protein [Flavobacterium sp. SUN052]|uniref:glycosyltransferase family 2 protein n=1 Tax=Flavobacterium sp. SUN052 TaxID=3002441 RepID=UPI00237D7E06|nr:glycosyltransferase family 2 protein [Flavobacterium sp. SUN052]MEC4003518.1 glycosyltransferase family 2 protein [Flavobacterium sp. SUN052]